MESSTSSPLLDEYGKPLPGRVQHVLDELAPRFRRKFSMIRDEVVAVEVLEHAGQRILNYEAEWGPVENLHGFAWVTLRNVAISRVRRGSFLVEQSIVSSKERAAVFSRLEAEEGGPKQTEERIFLREVLQQVSLRERRIAIWKRSGFSSQYIGEQLEMSASSVDTAYSRVCQRLRRIFGPRPLDGAFKRR